MDERLIKRWPGVREIRITSPHATATPVLHMTITAQGRWEEQLDAALDLMKEQGWLIADRLSVGALTEYRFDVDLGKTTCEQVYEVLDAALAASVIASSTAARVKGTGFTINQLFPKR